MLETVALNDLLADTVRNMLIHQYTVHDTVHLLHYLTAGCLARELDKYPDGELHRRESRRAIHLMRYFFSDSSPDITHICAIHNKLFILGMDHGATVDEYFGMLCQLEQGASEDKLEQFLAEYTARNAMAEELKQAIRLWNNIKRVKEEQYHDYPIEIPLHPTN